MEDPSSFIASSTGIPFAPTQLLHLKIGVEISVFPLRVAQKRCNKLVSGMFEVWPRCWWMVHVKHPIPPRGICSCEAVQKGGHGAIFTGRSPCGQPSLDPKNRRMKHSIQVKFVPGWDRRLTLNNDQCRCHPSGHQIQRNGRMSAHWHGRVLFEALKKLCIVRKQR